MSDHPFASWLHAEATTPAPRADRLAPAVPIERAQAHELVRSLGRPLCGGNRIELLRDAPAVSDALTRAIAGAADHINLCGDLVPTEAGDDIAERLVQRLRAGVKVNLCCEGFGALGFDAQAVERLAGAGVSLCGAQPASQGWAAWLPAREPRVPPGPLLVADGRRALVGGGGPAAFGLSVDGPAVRHLQRLFLRQWRRRSQQPLQPARYFPPLAVMGTQRIGIVDGEDRAARTRALVGALELAQLDIAIGTRASLPAHELRRALAGAARRGVAVTLLRHGDAQHLAATRSAWAPLIQAGLHVHEKPSGGDGAASELCLIDKVWLSLGACDPAAGLVVLDRTLARSVEQGFRSELAGAAEVSLDHADDGFARRRWRALLARRT